MCRPPPPPSMPRHATYVQTLPDLHALSALTDISAGGNRLGVGKALGTLPACLTKLVLKDNNLGEVPSAVLDGLPTLQV